MKIFSGGCHCGKIRFEMQSDLKSAIRCNCSMCRKKGAVMHKVKPEHFRLLSGQENLALYQFNTKIAKHLFCKVCGIYVYHHPRSTPDLIAININCLDDDIDLDSIEIISFDGKNWDTANLHKVGLSR